MQIYENQIFAVCSRNAVYHITSVKIQKLGSVSLNRQAAAQGTFDSEIRESEKAGL